MNYLGKNMKKISKIIVLAFILIFLSISCASASELDDNVRDGGIVDLEINENINQDLNDEDNSNSNLDNYPVNTLDNNLDNNLISNEEESVLDDSDSNEKNTLKSDSTTHQVTPTTYSQYFNRDGYAIADVVSSGDTIDLSGRFNKKNFIFTMPCSITSSQNDAYLTNCMIKFENVTSNSSSPSSVSNLNFNTSIEMAPCVYILGSSYVEVFNCNAYSTGANSNPTFLVGSSYCHIHNNVFETTFTGYMNMSWKRAGILLGESHYNNISSNFVSVKDSNPIYLTTYGYEKSNYNIIFNNTVTTSAFSNVTGLRNPSAWAYGVHIMGDYNLILNNTIMNTYRGVDSEGSFNQIIGNKIFNLSGSYYEGNNGTDGGEGGIFASYDNIIVNNTIYDSKITGPAIYAVVNTTVCGNTINNITGPNGIQFALSASNCLIHNNTINMNEGTAILVKGNMSNLTLSNNVISAKNGSGILIQKQTRAKFPVDVTIVNNYLLEDLAEYINYKDVEGKTLIILDNNTVALTNQTFFNLFDSDGNSNSSNLFENYVFKGEFSNLIYSNGQTSSEAVKTINLNENVTVIGENAIFKDISFNVNADNVEIDNILVNITDALSNAFSFNNANGCTLKNSVIYFNFTDSGGNPVPIFANNSRISLSNNTIIVYSDNIALALNNTNCTLSDNIFNSSSLNHEVILNDNNSILFFYENVINSLADPAVVTVNGAIIQYAYFIIEDSNYHEYFKEDGSFLDDVIFNFGDTLRIGNVNNKVFRFDIPLVILGEKGTIMNNSFIILEGESSNSAIINFTFKMANCEYANDISIITVKDGVSNLNISNNHFIINDLTGGHASLNAIKLIPSDIVATDIFIESNVMDIDSNLSRISGISIKNDDLRVYDEIISNMHIANNSISIINNKINGSAYGIELLSGLDSLIFNNSIYIKSYSANGILAEKSDLTILNNSIIVDGLNYEMILEYIGSNDLKNLLEEGQIKADSAISTDKNSILNDDIASVNILIENDAITNIIHSSNSLNDIASIIKNADDGFAINLGNNIYVIRDTIDINKSISIGNGILVSYLRDSNVLFNILNSSDFINNSFNISNSIVVLDNANVFVAVNSLNDEDVSLIDIPSINIKNNDFIAISDDVVPESITILKLISNREVLNPSNSISIESNQISSGMKAFEFDVRNVANGSVVIISNNNPLSQRTPTEIIFKDMVTVAVDPVTDGRIGEYFNFTLRDAEGHPVANKPMQIGFNGVIYNEKNGIVTNETGGASLQINLGYKGTYTFAICFLGDEKYNASFVIAKITVNAQKPVISCSNYYYKASTKSKKISITLKSARKKPLANKTIKLVLNGKTYSGKTNSNGLVTIKVSVSTKKTYSFTVKYGGSGTFSAVSKTAKLVIS